METVEQWGEKFAGLSLPTVLTFILALTAVRVVCRLIPTRFTRFLVDLIEPFILTLGVVYLVVRPFLYQPFFIPSGSMHPTLLENDRILVNKWVYRVQKPAFGDVIVFRVAPEVAPDEHEYIKRLIGLPGDVIEVREGFVRVETPIENIQYWHSDVRALLTPLLPPQTPSDEGVEIEEPPLHLTTTALWFGGKSFSPEEFAQICGKPGAKVTIEPGQVIRNGQILSETYVAEDPRYLFGPMLVPPNTYFVLGDNRNNSEDSHEWGVFHANRVVGRADYVFWPFNRLSRLTVK
jgi:signal peptidase I